MTINSPPVCQPVPESTEYGQVFLRQISCELVKSKTLTLRLNSSTKGNFQLVFDSPHAVRVIDEGQLCEFWQEYHQKNGWLWKVEEGGFLDLESNRDTFWLQDICNDTLVEYLVVGDQCVSVLTSFAPKFVADIAGL